MGEKKDRKGICYSYKKTADRDEVQDEQICNLNKNSSTGLTNIELLSALFHFPLSVNQETGIISFSTWGQKQREIYLWSSRKSTAEQGTKPGIFEFQTSTLTMGQLISASWEFLLPNCIR